jgi:hypothetical protein
MDLTRDEILEMEAGEEIDKLVAEKVMGWYVSSYGLVDREHKPGDVFLGDVCECWSPSFSISAAWEVVNKLKEQSDIVDVWHESWEWHCDIGSYGDCQTVKADTAPLAICRAALLAVIEK